MQVALAVCEPALVRPCRRVMLQTWHRRSLLALGSAPATWSAGPGQRCPVSSEHCLFVVMMPEDPKETWGRAHVPWLVIIWCGFAAMWFSVVHVPLYLVVSHPMFRSSPEDFPGASGNMKPCRYLSKVKVFCKMARVEVVFVCTAPCTNRSRSRGLVQHPSVQSSCGEFMCRQVQQEASLSSLFLEKRFKSIFGSNAALGKVEAVVWNL